MLKRVKITVDFDRHHPIRGDLRVVEALVLGGEDGVWGIYQQGDIIYFLGGDDGNWWVDSGFHRDWLPGIIAGCRRIQDGESQT